MVPDILPLSRFTTVIMPTYNTRIQQSPKPEYTNFYSYAFRSMEDEDISIINKTLALLEVAKYRSTFTVGIIIFSFFTALLEGIGLTFILPIIEVVQKGSEATQSSEGIVGIFFQAYSIVGVPFSLEFVILGVMIVMIVRYTSSFTSKWLSVRLSKEYERYFKKKTFDSALEAEISYYDKQGSDEILNAIITQTRYSGKVIRSIVNFTQTILLTLMYTAVAFLMAPRLTLLAAVLLGGTTYLVRYNIEPGFDIGDRVAQANEQIQTHAQAGTQGIREIKLFDIADSTKAEFREWVNTYTDSSIKLRRNNLAIQSSYEMLTAIILFGLLYIAISILSISLASLGVFLFAMFRLAPRISGLNSQFYTIEGQLPHLVRSQRFIEQLERYQEDYSSSTDVPDRVNRIRFDNVLFSYNGEAQVLDNISFDVKQGDFVGFVGQSGAGKSTIVSLLARMYDPNSGEILANGTPIDRFDIREWRKKISMVRQNPFIFNDTLRFNITMGENADQRNLEEAVEIAQVSEFLPDLPDGYNTILGDDGVRLSGGQRQRVALARALLADAEILILDEATSDLDSNLEQRIHSSMGNLDDDRFVFVIAHRLSTVRDADCIYTLQNGRITEKGSHKELVDNSGKYAELYKIQS